MLYRKIDSIGSHIIRNNEIFNCGQNGIVGHMGCVFSQIVHNHIYNIGVKHEFFGYEIEGIKLHAAIDVQLEENCIEHCTLGVWLDWEAQGARISRNLFFQNDRALFIEVTHGPQHPVSFPPQHGASGCRFCMWKRRPMVSQHFSGRTDDIHRAIKGGDRRISEAENTR